MDQLVTLVFLLSTGSAVVALDWRPYLKGDGVEPVKSFIAACHALTSEPQPLLICEP